MNNKNLSFIITVIIFSIFKIIIPIIKYISSAIRLKNIRKELKKQSFTIDCEIDLFENIILFIDYEHRKFAYNDYFSTDIYNFTDLKDCKLIVQDQIVSDINNDNFEEVIEKLNNINYLFCSSIYLKILIIDKYGIPDIKRLILLDDLINTDTEEFEDVIVDTITALSNIYEIMNDKPSDK